MGGDQPTIQPGYPPLQDPSLPPYPSPGGSSQPLYPYGQPGAPSQPLYPYGGYAPPSQYPPTGTGARTSHRGLITGVVIGVVVLALLGSGAFVGINQYQAPAQAAQQFCSTLTSQDYVAAYNMLSSNLQSEYTSDQFTLGSQLLDKAEGNVISCGAASGSSYDYTLFGSTATISSVIDRAQSGTLTGKLHLINQNGWKISGIDTSLLGVNLTSLQTVQSFCTSLQNGDYSGAYSVLGSTLQSQVSESTFAQDGSLHQQIDGPVTGCSIVGFGQGNTDISTNLSVSITRSTLGTVIGQTSLDMEGGTWKISSINTALEGSDLGGLFVVQKFCSYLKSGQVSKAYGLTSTPFQSANSLSYFESIFIVPGLTFSCTFQLSTYKVPDPLDAHINGSFVLTGQGAQAQVPAEFFMVKEGSNWKFDRYTLSS
jgi:hypothetical protein